MSKKERKELEQQLGLAIAYFLKKQDEKAASQMAKPIRSASRELAKKFLKHQEKAAAGKPALSRPAKTPATAPAASAAPVKKTAKAGKAVKKSAKAPAKAAKKK